MGSNNFIGVKDIMGRAYRSFLNIPVAPTEDDLLISAIKGARRDYKMAESRFNEATNQDLVDQAIYDMLSAKTKYTYLMKQAREKDLHF
ncbi:DUF2508 family protein [Bacilliculturomica massiliensis]|uniref:DUF2508 family protein n=1 Tax=Bacilliculturomica massiliensis TaxID=1917867 RepID=UPI0013EF4E14|nr:DUF2508 family protein [Bacilliculturomica massiliensis]